MNWSCACSPTEDVSQQYDVASFGSAASNELEAIAGPTLMDDIESVLRRAISLSSSGAIARKSGEEAAADEYFREALALVVEAVNQVAEEGASSRLSILRTADVVALECGEVDEARRLIDEGESLDPSTVYAEEWAQLRDVAAWTDAWLIAAVRRDPPDERALNVLVGRYWRHLFGRCQVLTV